MKTDPTTRFTDRVSNYVKYRPGYPLAVLDYLIQETGISPESQIGEIGSGTGIFSALLLDLNCRIYGVEPNEAMRTYAEMLFRDKPNFISIDGTAEKTTLKSDSINLVVCAQAFHWFRPNEARDEFKRIFKNKDGQVALIWNNRLTEFDAFSVDYETLLQNKASDYKEINHQNLNDVDFKGFFRNGEYTVQRFDNKQTFDLEGLAGRAFSSSYIPAEATEAGKEFARLLSDIFGKHQVRGKVDFHYQTEVYLGKI